MSKSQYYHQRKKPTNHEKEQNKITFYIRDIEKDKLINSQSNMEYLKCKLQSNSGIKFEKEIEFYVFSMNQENGSGEKYNLNLRFKGLFANKKAYLDQNGLIKVELSAQDYQRIMNPEKTPEFVAFIDTKINEYEEAIKDIKKTLEKEVEDDYFFKVEEIHFSSCKRLLKYLKKNHEPLAAIDILSESFNQIKKRHTAQDEFIDILSEAKQLLLSTTEKK